MTETAAPVYSLWQLVRYMLGLGSWGFGGPVALVGYMYRDLVERRCWIAEPDFKEGMALAQLMPGPHVKCSNRVTISPAFEPGLAEGDTSAFVTGLLRIFQ